MLKVIGYVVGFIVVAIVIVVAIAATKPATFRVERSIDIAAPPAKIAAQIEDFHNWKQWSPWEHLDPNQITTFSGAASGVGAMYDWSGNKQVGQGHMEVVGASPTETKVRVLFIKPFPGDNMSTFTYTPNGAVTHVSWVMDGPVSFPGKIMSVFTTMDKMIGPDFERGLASLKQTAER